MKVKIDMKAFEEFQATLPDDIRLERFRWVRIDYSIPKALFLIKQQSLECRELRVANWCKSLGMDGPRKEGTMEFNLFNGVTDDKAMQDKIKPEEFPLILAEHTFKGKNRKNESCTLIIDGNKRLRKAFLCGIEKLKAYYLPKTLSKLCIQ